MAHDPCLCLRAFDCIVEAHGLNALLDKEIRQHIERPELPPCIPKAMLTWMENEVRPEWSKLASLLPKLVEIFGTSNTIDPIWTGILTSERMTMDRTLDTLCALADTCFPPKTDSSQQIRYDYSISQELWSVLFRALDGSFSSERKKALSLIKKVSEFISKHDSQIRMNFDVSKAEMVPFIRKNDRTRPDAVAAFRQTFFLIVQSLEERDKKMVMPALRYVADLTEVYTIQNYQGYIFDKKWMQCIYKRILKHNDVTVRKAGFREILRTDLEIFDESFFDFVAKRLREVLLYEFDYTQSESPEIVQELAAFFGRSERDGKPLTNMFLRSISKFIWSTVSLHWVLKAFVIVTDEDTQIVHNIWGEEELRSMSKLIITNLSTNHTLLPETRWVLHEMMRVYISSGSRWSDVGLVATAIQHIAGLGKLDTSGPYLQRMINSADAQAYIIQQCDTLWPEQSSESFADTIVAFIFSNLILSDGYCCARTRLHVLFEKMNETRSRLHRETATTLKALELASCLMKKCKRLNNSVLSLVKFKRFLLRHMTAWVKMAESFLTYHSILPEHKRITMALIKYNAADYVDDLSYFYDQCVLTVDQDPAIIGKARWVFALRVIYTYNQHYFEQLNLDPPGLSIHQIQLIIKYFQGEILEAYSSDKEVVEECCQAIARFIADYIQFGNELNQTETALFLEELRFLVDTAPRETISIAVKLIVELFQPTQHHRTLNDENTNIVISLIHAMCRLVLQFEEVEKESLSMLIYSQLLSRRFFLDLEGSRVFAAKWVSQFMDGASHMSEFKTAFITDITYPEKGLIFIQSIVRCYFHGITLDIERRIENLAAGLYGPEGEIDYSEDKILVAYTVISIMDLLERVVGKKSAFREKMLEGFLTVLRIHRNQVYGHNSVIHKIKSRTYQALLMMVSYLDEIETRRLYNEVCTLLIFESNQSSIRMMQEWLIVRMYTKTMKDKSIWNVFKLGMEKRPENITSIVSITFHIAKVFENKARIEFVGDAMRHLLPYCIGHRFNSRFGAQIHMVLVTLHEMLPANYQFQVTPIFEKLRADVPSMKEKKGADAWFNDFYFEEFHADNDLNLEMIYEHVPRLMGLQLGERIEIGIFEALMDPSAYEALEVYALGKWIDIEPKKPPVGSIRGDGDNDDERNKEGFVLDVQDKLKRFATVGPLTDDLSDDARMEYERKIAQKSSAGIIVVATLVSQLRHLGHLARTCKVFAVKEFVIGNLKSTNRQAFKRMSSSAEKHITITEVRKDLLKKYLIRHRAKGWKVVGAQRLAGSANVLDVEFNRKTILLLGNENTGIPADLLPLCDMCVTVPGHGAIRSLNIQVAGAVCILEYAKQHTFSQL